MGDAHLTLRMDFLRWSQAVDSGAMPAVRQWLADVEAKINIDQDDFARAILFGTGADPQPFKGLVPRYPAPARQYGSSPGQQALATFRALSGETGPP